MSSHCKGCHLLLYSSLLHPDISYKRLGEGELCMFTDLHIWLQRAHETERIMDKIPKSNQ